MEIRRSTNKLMVQVSLFSITQEKPRGGKWHILSEDGEVWTLDHKIKSFVLYQLSYTLTNGSSGWIWTNDHCLIRATLYTTELRYYMEVQHRIELWLEDYKSARLPLADWTKQGAII